MSILEENVIDSASIENGILILTISDHLNYRKFLYRLEGALLKLKLRFSHGTISYFYS